MKKDDGDEPGFCVCGRSLAYSGTTSSAAIANGGATRTAEAVASGTHANGRTLTAASPPSRMRGAPPERVAALIRDVFALALRVPHRARQRDLRRRGYDLVLVRCVAASRA